VSAKSERKLSKLLVGLALLLFGAWVVVYGLNVKEAATAKINRSVIYIEVAQTSEEKQQGLSGRQSLGNNEGLLFVYDQPEQHQFWMKDMNFPIDIIWIADDYRVVDITKNLTPDTYPERFTSSKPAQYVLEVNAGYSDELDIRIGDEFELTY